MNQSALGALAVAAVLMVAMPAAGSVRHKSEKDLAALSTVSMEQAIKTATEKVPGHVVRAVLEEERGKGVYELRIVNEVGETHKVEIDAKSGAVIESEAMSAKSKARHEKSGDKEDSR